MGFNESCITEKEMCRRREMKARCIYHDLVDMELDDTLQHYINIKMGDLLDIVEDKFGDTKYKLCMIREGYVSFNREIDHKIIKLSLNCLKECTYSPNGVYEYSDLESYIIRSPIEDNKLKLKVVNHLIIDSNFNTKDAYEVADFIIKQEENQHEGNKSYDFCMFGARWCDNEVVNYINGDCELSDDELVTDIETILSWDNFTRLESGLIVSWRY